MQIEAVGLLRIMARVQRMITNGDFTPAPQKIGEYLQRVTAQGFRVAPWLPSARANEAGGRTLTDTGALSLAILSVQPGSSSRMSFQSSFYAGSFYERIRRGASNHTATGHFRIWNARVEIGVSSRYAVPTQYGSRNVPASMVFGRATFNPPRPFLRIYPWDVEAIKRNLFVWAARSFSQAETGGR